MTSQQPRRGRSIAAALVAGLAASLTLTAPADAATPVTKIYTVWKVTRSSSEPAILHCVRNGEIIAPAHVVKPGQAKKFACTYRVLGEDAPTGVMVWQPRDRSVRITTHGFPVKFYPAQSFGGRDVWADQGNPGGRHTVTIS